ncbi:serine/threonine protein kinase [Nocardiopsis sp. NPDC055879]
MSGSAPGPVRAPGYDTSTQLRQGRRARIIRATRATSGAEVVLKVLPVEAGQVELGHLRTLNGVPGVVPLLDAGSTADGAFFIAMPYYPDGSFGEMLAKRGPAPLQEAAAIARSVAAALGALHARGLLHNDVCPGNVLRAGRTPVLTGFGAVSTSGEPLTPPSPQMESFLHSAPEALRGEPRTPASDVYQLASTIWTLLMGRAPFSSTDGSPFDPQAYARRVLSEEPAPVPRPDVSRSLRRVLTRGLTKDPAGRFPNPSEFAAAFEKARSGRTATAPSGAQPSMSGIAPTNAPSGPQTPPASSGPQTPPAHSGPQSPPVATGPQSSTAPSGPQAPPVPPGPQNPPTAPTSQAPPVAPPTPPSPGPTGHPSGAQVPHLSVPSGPHAPPAPFGTGPQRPPHVPAEGTGHGFPQDGFPPAGGGDRGRLESAARLRPSQRPLPTPEERELHGAVPEDSDHSTADLMMAKLRGEEVSTLRAWSRLDGWSGDAKSAYLPVDEAEEESSDPEWDSLSAIQEPPRWRKQMHIAVTVCGVLVAGMVASAFAATSTPEPVVAVAAEETEEEPVEEDAPAQPVAEPSPLPEVSPASNVMLEDTLSAVTLNWTDNTGGTGSYFVVGGPQGHDPRTLARTGPGAVTAQVPTENTQVEYCFTLVAVDEGSAPAEEVCTTRAADRAAEAERQAEEEAEREEEEEAEADPSPSPSPNADD